MSNTFNENNEIALTIPTIAHIVWEDYGCVNIHHTQGTAEYLILWQVSGMEECGKVVCSSFEEAMTKSLSIVEGIPEQVLVAIEGSNETFVELALTTEDTEEIVAEALSARKRVQEQDEAPGFFVKLVSTLFKKKATERIDNDGE